jgi:hypothetical protein
MNKAYPYELVYMLIWFAQPLILMAAVWAAAALCGCVASGERVTVDAAGVRAEAWSAGFLSWGCPGGTRNITVVSGADSARSPR